MANYKTGAERYNDRMNKIWDESIKLKERDDKKIILKKDYQKVILFDLEALKDDFITQNKKDVDYHFNLLKNNFKDYFKLTKNYYD